VATSGVTVNAVCPGFTDTDLVAGSIDNIMSKTGRSRDEAIAELAKHNPQGRLVTPAEVANAVVWLCSPGASSVTDRPSRWPAENLIFWRRNRRATLIRYLTPTRRFQ